MPKIQYTIKIDSVILKRAQKFAQADNRSLNNFIETAIIKAVEGKLPKQSTSPETAPEIKINNQFKP